MLHRVVEKAPRSNPFNLCISQRDLAKVIVYLRRAGYTLSTLDEVLDARECGESIDRRACLTFDDGYEDFATRAMPVLREQDCPATVFLIADRLGEMNAWDAGSGLPEARLMTRETILSLVEEGVAFGSHSATHVRLTEVDDFGLYRELVGSKRALESLLQRPVRTLAYPYLDNDERVRHAALSAGYEAAFGGEQSQHTLSLLHRIDLPRYDTLSMHYRLRGGHARLQRMPFVGDVKRLLRTTLGARS